ncbi:MAG: NYN domain-containing protein [Candidatus Poribacteria bacterium]|nr:NYN domain-containing protein [Candidatus Poribacteria bacterium]
MSYRNLKLQIHRDQLTWFLDLLLDEREIFQLSASTGIVPDVDKLYALSRRELLVNLTDAFLGVVGSPEPTVENSDAHTPKPGINNGDVSIEALASQFLSEKAQAAISRIGYMEVSEIETFFKTSDVLIEAGDFGEVVWALLTDQRTAVVEHGYKLLNTTYESINVAYTNGYEPPISNEQLEEIRVEAADNLEAEDQQSGRPVQEIEQLEQQLAGAKADYLSLEKKHSRLDQQRAFLLEENKGLKTKTETQHENEKRLKELEQENSVLRERVTRYTEDTAALQQLANEREVLLAEKERLADQLREYEQIKSAKETFTTDLKLVEEAIYRGHQGLEDFQTSLDSHFDTLESCHQAARGALNQIRQTLTYLDTQQINDGDAHYGITPEQPRVGVFVDVQNMFYAAKDRFGRRVDYIKLLDLIVGPRYLMVAYAYVVQIPEINQSSFLSLLEHNGYTIKSKDLRLRGDGSAKGDWDVGIAVDVVSMLGSLDVVILASGDGDFCPLAELIKQQNKRVEVVAFEHNTSMDLQQIADQFFPIGDELLIS